MATTINGKAYVGTTVNDPDRLPNLPRDVVEGVSQSLHFATIYTRPIVQNSQDVRGGFGTGFLVGIGNRLFLASAKHCLTQSPRIVAHQETFNLPCPPTRCLNVRLAPNRDVGFLELVNNENIPRLPVSCLCPDRPDESQDRRTYIVGCPWAEYTRTTNFTGITLTNFGTQVLHITADEYLCSWPDRVTRHQSATDTFEDRQINFTPHGCSGGGLWVFEMPNPNALILPEALLKVYAIQSAYNPSQRLLKCVPIRHWIGLVYDTYEDLRPELAGRFPFLAARR